MVREYACTQVSADPDTMQSYSLQGEIREVGSGEILSSEYSVIFWV